MRNIRLICLLFAALSATQCTRLQDVENRILNLHTNSTVNSYYTNTFYISNKTVLITNIVQATNIVKVSDSVYKTNVVTVNKIFWLTTNYITKGVNFQPLPQKIFVYVDSGGRDWTSPTVYWWDYNGKSGNISKISNYSKSGFNWWVFILTNMDIRNRFGIKVHNNNWANVEPIKGENGKLYDRVVTMPILSKVIDSISSTTNGIYITNTVATSIESEDKIFVYPPANWWESYPYLFANETNFFRNPDGLNVWDQYMGANYWGNGVTFFTFYAPNVRRAWVAGDFSGWQKVPMYLATDRSFWWVKLSNTLPRQAYKIVIEKYGNQWGGPSTNFISDPAAKKNEYSPAMNSDGNKSFIVDQNEYQWGDDLWNRPGFDYYTIYQMHMRTFETNSKSTWWGWGNLRIGNQPVSVHRRSGFHGYRTASDTGVCG